MKILCLTAPTATGKTALTQYLASHFPIEVISADSRQIYQWLNIGTAKPTPDELVTAPHHLIDFLPPDQKYNAGQFAEDASRAIQEIFERNKIPIVVGGTGFYIQSLVEGIAPAPEVSQSIIESLQPQTDEELYRQLLQIDPVAASNIHPHNRQKVIRALSVYQATQTPFSQFSTLPKHQFNDYSFAVVWLQRERDVVYQRINRRANQMVEAGLIEETQCVLDQGFSPDCPGLNSIGYTETLQYLKGILPYTDLAPAIAQATRRYAKRQITWLRHHRIDQTIRADDFASLHHYFQQCYEL